MTGLGVILHVPKVKGGDDWSADRRPDADPLPIGMHAPRNNSREREIIPSSRQRALPIGAPLRGSAGQRYRATQDDSLRHDLPQRRSRRVEAWPDVQVRVRSPFPVQPDIGRLGSRSPGVTEHMQTEELPSDAAVALTIPARKQTRGRAHWTL
ncbi:unnamed protein product [Effrenium voratum]|nr:unnamed protein product [Effrenium voratum]